MTFDLRAVVYAANGARLGVLRDLQTLSASGVLNDVPALSLKVPSVSAGLLAGFVEVAVEYSDGGAWVEPANSRFIKVAWSSDTLRPIPLLDASIPGYAWLLRTASVREAGAPNTVNTDSDGKRKFSSATAGTILATLIGEAKGRGSLPGMTLDFSPTKDSSGTAWSKVVTLAYKPGLGLHQVLDNLAAQGVIDWEMQGRALRIFNADAGAGLARDLTTGANPTSLLVGRDVDAAPDQGDASGLIHRAYLRGDEGKVWEVTSPVAPAPWGSFEATIDQGGVSDEGTARILIEQALDDGSQERVQMTRDLILSPSSPLPHRDYRVGDHIFAPGRGAARERLRVYQITLTRNATGNTSGSLVLNDRFVEASLRRAKRTEGIVGGSKLGGGSGAQPAVSRPETATPATPGAPTLTSRAYVTTSGASYAVLYVGWSEVDTDVNGYAIGNVDSYGVRGRRAAGAARAARSMARAAVVEEPWQSLAEMSGSSVACPSLPVGETWELQVRAVYRGRAGAWSDSVFHLLEQDFEPPPVPSKPILTSRLGTITVAWDGKNAQGGGMPPDFDRIEVRRDGDPEVIGTLRKTTGHDFIVVTDVPYDTNAIFDFRAIDVTGNISDWSATAMTKVTPLVDVDLIGEIVGTENIQAKAITAAKIAALSIEAGHVAANAITADKIKAGAITTEKLDARAITAGKIAVDAIDAMTITGATIRTAASGARTELGSAGLQVHSASTELVRIGHGLTNGLAVRNPNTGALTELAAVAFGMKTGEASALWNGTPPNAWTPLRDSRLGVQFVAPTNRVLILASTQIAKTSGNYGGASQRFEVVGPSTVYTGYTSCLLQVTGQQTAQPATEVVTVTPGATYTVYLNWLFSSDLAPFQASRVNITVIPL